MKTWIKVATGILGGIAIIFSLGGFGSKEKRCECNTTAPIEEEEIPDEIFDGKRDLQINTRETNENKFRNFQEGLAKASNILGHVGIIVSSVIKMFYGDPYIKVTPTTYIL